MKSQWKIRSHCFNGAGTYTLKFAATDGGEQKIPVVVDAEGYFEIEQPATPGIYAFAHMMVSGVEPNP